MKRNRPARKPKKEYPFMAFRPTVELDKRLRRLSERSGQSVSSLVVECVEVHLPTLEGGR